MQPKEPVGRLHSILAAAQKQGGKKSIRQVWAEVFGIPPDDTAEILFTVGELITLVRDAKEAVAALPDVDNKLYLRPFAQVETLFATANLDQPWNQVQQRLDATTMYGLQVGSDAVSRFRPEPIIGKDDLEKVEAALDALCDEVTEATVDQQLKAIILEQADAIRRALRNYRIWGSKGLLRNLERSFGAAYLHSDLFEEAKDTRVVKDFIKVLVTIKTVLDIVHATQAVGSGILRLMAGS